jgi:hypothetical protein
MKAECRLDRCLGRRVLATNNRVMGRLEEFRAEKRGSEWVVTEFVIGAGGLLERLHLGIRLLAGGKRRGLLARWDQLDLREPERPRLRCPREELRQL